MRAWLLLIASIAVGNHAWADTIMPSAKGTTWVYQMTQEFGQGVHPSAENNVKIDADGKVRLPVQIFAAASEKVDGVNTTRYEMHRQGAIQLIEFLQVTNDAVTAVMRADTDGTKFKLNPPQKILTLPPRTGEKWQYKGQVGDIDTTQIYETIAQEQITVPAGKFDAFHVRVTQVEPTQPQVTEDRWFVPNVGYARILTATKRGDGQLLQKIDLELAELPKIGEQPAIAATPAEKKLLHAAVASQLTGEPQTSFPLDTPKLYLRWQGETLNPGDKIRCVWIAEDVGAAAPANYQVNETSTKTAEIRGFGTFILSRPTKGWPIGQYRAEIYVGDKLAETVKFTIEKSDR
jgi:hypothetical protein